MFLTLDCNCAIFVFKVAYKTVSDIYAMIFTCHPTVIILFFALDVVRWIFLSITK